MGKHSLPSPGEPSGASGAGDGDTPSGRIPRADGSWQGRRRRTDGGRRGVSVGVIAALVGVVVLVGGVILWRFFGDALSQRSTDAARQCVEGTATVAVVADPAIAVNATAFAEAYNDEARPVGDKCVNVVVREADSATVLGGLTGTWPAELGERPALWIPASSLPAAQLQIKAGKQIVSDARSLVTTPVVLAMRPQLKEALGGQGWPALPGLQNNPTGLDALNLPGWGPLRLALPATGAADAGYLVAEAVATTSAPPGAPATGGLPAAGALLAGQPRLANDSAGEAWNALMAGGDPAAAPVHAVAITEQQFYQRTSDLADAAELVAQWFPAGPVAVADFPTVLLDGPWLSEEQVAAASEFARFMRKPEQMAALVDAGFRTEDAAPKGNAVVDFGPLPAPLPVGDDAVRAAIAAAAVPGAAATTTVMLNQSLPTAPEALRDRLAALPPSAAVGLWTFNQVEGQSLVTTGPLADDVGGQPRGTALTAVLEQLVPTGSGVSFTTLRLVYADAVANYRPGQPNSVLVITQGPHTDRTLDGPGLEEFVRSAVDPNRPVAVNIVTVAGDPDRATWEAVAQLTGGTYQEVPGPDSPDLIAAVSRLLD